MTVSRITGLSLLLLLLVAPIGAHADDQKNLNLLSRKVLKPLVTMNLQRHWSPVQMHIGAPGMKSLDNNTTRVIYYTNIQLADGTLMKMPESYDVTRDASSTGKFASVYEIRPAGEKTSIMTVALRSDDQIVVLKGGRP